MHSILLIILLFIPSLYWLIRLLQFLSRFKATARKHRSTALDYIFSNWFITLSVLGSWSIVLLTAIDQHLRGMPILSWQILLLPIGWGLIAWVTNYYARK